MKRVALMLFVCLVLPGIVICQDKNGKNEKMTSAQKKAEREAKIQKQFLVTDSLLRSMQFVLEARLLKFSDGDRIPVSTTLNFVALDSLNATVQIGSFQHAGYNGVGGITEPGKVKNWKFSRDDKRKNFFITFTIICDRHTYDVMLNSDYSGYADATLNGIRAGSLTFEGNIVSPDDSVIYKGQKR
jgi:hypothetical protein